MQNPCNVLSCEATETAQTQRVKDILNTELRTGRSFDLNYNTHNALLPHSKTYSVGQQTEARHEDKIYNTVERRGFIFEFLFHLNCLKVENELVGFVV